jgi:hypothetical protein
MLRIAMAPSGTSFFQSMLRCIVSLETPETGNQYRYKNNVYSIWKIMNRVPFVILFTCIITIKLAVVGCDSGSVRVKQFYINSSSASEAAIKQHDKDGNGSLDSTELKSIASIGNVSDQYDTDRDGQVSALEIRSRIDKWQVMKVAVVSCSFVVKLDGKPLPEAKVRLDSEPFLADTLRPCFGATDSRGRVTPSQQETSIGNQSDGLTGVPPGLYRVSITHPKLEKLKQYHSETILGLQIAPDDPSLMNLELKLDSR